MSYFGQPNLNALKKLSAAFKHSNYEYVTISNRINMLRSKGLDPMSDPIVRNYLLNR